MAKSNSIISIEGLDNTLKNLNTDDLQLNNIEITIDSLNEIKEVDFLERKLPIKDRSLSIDTPLSVKVGDIGELWSMRNEEYASASIGDNYCDVFSPESYFKDNKKIKVSAIRDGKIYVEVIEEKENIA